MSVRRVGPKRPIDKNVSFLFDDSITTAQIANIVRTSKVAETFSGGSINGCYGGGDVGGKAVCALVIIRDGALVSNLNVTAIGLLYQPEQDVIWSRAFAGAGLADSGLIAFSDKIKTMRKLRENDAIVFIQRGSTGADSGSFAFVLTHFYKQ